MLLFKTSSLIDHSRISPLPFQIFIPNRVSIFTGDVVEGAVWNTSGKLGRKVEYEDEVSHFPRNRGCQ